MADIEQAMDTLNEMLSSQDGKQALTDMVSSLTSSNDGGGLLGVDTMLKLKGAMEELENKNDSRKNLLLALKPFLNQTRLSRVDETINLLKIAKLPGVIKGIRR